MYALDLGVIVTPGAGVLRGGCWRFWRLLSGAAHLDFKLGGTLLWSRGVSTAALPVSFRFAIVSWWHLVVVFKIGEFVS